jgi:hypothetical protein
MNNEIEKKISNSHYKNIKLQVHSFPVIKVVRLNKIFDQVNCKFD